MARMMAYSRARSSRVAVTAANNTTKPAAKVKANKNFNLEEVNRRLADKGMREIDPNDPEMAEKYGLTAPQPDIVEQEMQDQANL